MFDTLPRVQESNHLRLLFEKSGTVYPFIERDCCRVTWFWSVVVDDLPTLGILIRRHGRTLVRSNQQGLPHE